MFFVFSYAKLLVYRLFIACKVTCICHVDKYQVMMIFASPISNYLVL